MTHLPSNCSTDDIIDILERDGAAIVDGFVDYSWLNDFNAAIQTSVDSYTPYDYCEPEAIESLGHQTVRLNGLAGKAPGYIHGGETAQALHWDDMI